MKKKCLKPRRTKLTVREDGTAHWLILTRKGG